MSWYPYNERPHRTPEQIERAKNNPIPFLRDKACCEKATQPFCVCMIHWTCPEHGEVHIGTHD